MKIALMGTRGVPASYSGFETCVEQLGARLVKRGHDVYVYCRSHHIDYDGEVYKGMNLIKLPTIKNKYLDTLVHTILSSLHALFQRYDVAIYFIAGNSPATWIPRIVKTKTILNVDGLDWKREKWPQLAKSYIKFAEFLATKLPNCFLTDSKIVQSYYSDTYDVKPPYIPYGSDVSLIEAGKTLQKYELEKDEYVLFVGRLVPENGVHHIIEAFRECKTAKKCVIVGDSKYSDEYKTQLYDLAREDSRIIFTGYVFGEGYLELGSNAYLFIESSGVGGTHPALIEAMAFGNCVIVNDTEENLETIGGQGFSYPGRDGADGLKPVLEKLLQNPDLVCEYSVKAKQRATDVYSWDGVTDQYEALCYSLIKT